ncbi:MAG TPA: sigma-70 family RNA polymerase sigma factor [Oscillospiraceae bacterium]|nr:sigma-70 family RNA polymerase sigma factor [Oscillospiraceae bacterium]
MAETLAGNRAELIERNLGLVHACAHRFTGRGIEYDDLFQAGCMGLVKAFDAFDRNRGVCFSTYAVPVILGEIRRLFRDGGTVKVSRTLKELSLKVGREREFFLLREGREPTVSELSQKLLVSEEAVTEAICSATPVISLTVDDEDGNGGQTDVPVDSPEEAVTERLSTAQAVQTLDKKERALIILRYYKGMTQSAAAARLGMTQVQVSRKEKKILEKLKRELCG